MVKLYKIVGDKVVLVDYGVVSKAESYAKQGFIVVVQRPEA